MLDLWDENCKYLIFDDMPWERMKSFYKSFLGAQKEFVLTDKYRHKRNVKWGKPCIFLCNADMDPIFNRVEGWEWIRDNCTYVNITERLY